MQVLKIVDNTVGDIAVVIAVDMIAAKNVATNCGGDGCKWWINGNLKTFKKKKKSLIFFFKKQN